MPPVTRVYVTIGSEALRNYINHVSVTALDTECRACARVAGSAEPLMLDCLVSPWSDPGAAD